MRVVKTSPNTRPTIMWVLQTSHGVGNLYPLDGGSKHTLGGSCACKPKLEIDWSEPVWVHHTELERQVVPNHLPDSI